MAGKTQVQEILISSIPIWLSYNYNACNELELGFSYDTPAVNQDLKLFFIRYLHPPGDKNNIWVIQILDTPIGIWLLCYFYTIVNLLDISVLS